MSKRRRVMEGGSSDALGKTIHVVRRDEGSGGVTLILKVTTGPPPSFDVTFGFDSPQAFIAFVKSLGPDAHGVDLVAKPKVAAEGVSLSATGSATGL